VIGSPVKPIEEPQPDPHRWTPESLAAFKADVEAFFDELLARHERDQRRGE
jgi:hypothetical protein